MRQFVNHLKVQLKFLRRSRLVYVSLFLVLLGVLILIGSWQFQATQGGTNITLNDLRNQAQVFHWLVMFFLLGISVHLISVARRNRSLKMLFVRNFSPEKWLLGQWVILGGLICLFHVVLSLMINVYGTAAGLSAASVTWPLLVYYVLFSFVFVSIGTVYALLVHPLLAVILVFLTNGVVLTVLVRFTQFTGGFTKSFLESVGYIIHLLLPSFTYFNEISNNLNPSLDAEVSLSVAINLAGVETITIVVLAYFLSVLILKHRTLT